MDINSFSFYPNVINKLYCIDAKESKIKSITSGTEQFSIVLRKHTEKKTYIMAIIVASYGDLFHSGFGLIILNVMS